MTEIISRGYGNTHEIARVICEAAHQAGYDAMTVSLFNDRKELCHVVCEIRGKGKAAVVDARFRKIWKDTAFEKLFQDPALSAGVWPDDIAKSAKSHLYNLPAEVQDYKVFNQNLQKAIMSTGFSGAPRLSEDPRERIERYLMGFKEPDKVPATYWRYPFIVMLSSPDFPSGWRLDFEKVLEQGK